MTSTVSTLSPDSAGLVGDGLELLKNEDLVSSQATGTNPANSAQLGMQGKVTSQSTTHFPMGPISTKGAPHPGPTLLGSFSYSPEPTQGNFEKWGREANLWAEGQCPPTRFGRT